jgi:hypothetical protein
VFQPARNHAYDANRHAHDEDSQQHQYQRRTPRGAKKEMDHGVVLVVQCESEQGKKKWLLSE